MAIEFGKLTRLGVLLDGPMGERRVGTILRLAGDRQMFVLEEEYVDDPGRPTLSLSLKRTGGRVGVRERPVHRRVPPWFANLLPEGALRDYLAAKAGVNAQREFILLAVLGGDLSGAVRVVPEEGELVEAGDARARKRAGDGVLRFSLAGVQLKFSAVENASGGLTIPAHGLGGLWILKLPSLRREAVAENEFVMLELARSVGIEVPRTQLVRVRDVEGLPSEAARLKGMALAVERFDRTGGGARVHVEDFAQVFDVYPEEKYKRASYASLAKVLSAEAGDVAVVEFVKRVVFSVLIGNADMHLKNWSLIYRDGRRAELAPAYDFVSTLPYIPDDSLALSFSGSKVLSGVNSEQVGRIAREAGVPSVMLVREVKELVERTVESWKVLEEKAVLPPAMRKAIGQQIEGSGKRSLAELGG